MVESSMVKIRLKLLGSRKHKFFHIVVEQIGYYEPKNPRTGKTTENLVINWPSYNKWVGTGAQPTDSLVQALQSFPQESDSSKSSFLETNQSPLGEKYLGQNNKKTDFKKMEHQVQEGSGDVQSEESPLEAVGSTEN